MEVAEWFADFDDQDSAVDAAEVIQDAINQMRAKEDVSGGSRILGSMAMIGWLEVFKQAPPHIEDESLEQEDEDP